MLHENSQDHTIHLMTAEIGGPGGPAHNFIAFRDPDGHDKVLMYGLSIVRQNSSIKALRGVMVPPYEQGLPFEDFTMIGDSLLFKGDVKIYLHKMAMAVDALHFINAQNLNYRPDDTNGDSPNSIAHSLVNAMDCEFPEEATHFWAPGHERILLPKNWRSVYA